MPSESEAKTAALIVAAIEQKRLVRLRTKVVTALLNHLIMGFITVQPSCLLTRSVAPALTSYQTGAGWNWT